MVAEENKAVVQRFNELFVECWRTGDTDILEEVLASGFVYHSPGAPLDLGISMKMSSRRWSFERSPIAQHRPQDVNPSPGQGDQGLGVPLALFPFAVVERSGGRRATQTGKSRLVESSFEDFIATPHPTVIAGAFARVVGSRHQPGIGGELIGALEGGEVSHTDQKLGAENRTHPGQASDDLGLLSGKKTLSQLLVESLDAFLESEHFPSEFRNDARGDAFGGQGDALGGGSAEGFPGEAVEPLDATVSEIGGNSFAAGTAKLCWSLVVGEESEGATPVQIQCSLQSWKQRKKRLSEAGYAAAFVNDEVASASEQKLKLGKIALAGDELTEIGAHTSLVGDDMGISGVGFGLSTVGVAGAVHGEARDIKDSLASLPQQRQQKRRAASGLVDGPHDVAPPGQGEDAVDELKEIRLLVFDPAGEQPHPRGIQHVGPVKLLASIDARPNLVHESLHSPLPAACPWRTPPTAPYEASSRRSLSAVRVPIKAEGRFQSSHL
jgi:hypothetical protein